MTELDTLMAATTIHHHVCSHLSQSSQDFVDCPPVKLSLWMENAIIEGRYTPEQIDILRAQKRHVQAVIATVQRDSLLGQQVNLTPSRTAFRGPSTATEKLNLPVPIVQVPLDEAGTKESLLVEAADTLVVSPPRPKITPRCNYRTCQVCRPISRDRAWQCLGHAFDSNTQNLSPDFASDLRPVSDASQVRRLGLWKPRPRPQTFESFDSIVLTDDEDDDDDDEDDESQTGISRQNSQSRRQSRESSSTGFRASARRAFQDMMIVSRRTSTRSRDSKDSSTSTLNATAKIHKRDDAHTKWIEEKEYMVFGDVGTRLSRYGRQRRLWRQDGRIFGDNPSPRNSLFKATTDKADAYTGSELKLENGVAVTEEAIDLGSADIIIQV
ncbi:hypothetical protein MMC18_002342 [Xylographa bjoerkii]|nr:hypothetical protein [Xylographa bjoerkii]